MNSNSIINNFNFVTEMPYFVNMQSVYVNSATHLGFRVYDSRIRVWGLRFRLLEFRERAYIGYIFIQSLNFVMVFIVITLPKASEKGPYTLT